jgi:hypothetical protein
MLSVCLYIPLYELLNFWIKLHKNWCVYIYRYIKAPGPISATYFINFLHYSVSIYIHIKVYKYIYIYMCVCVCVCVWIPLSLLNNGTHGDHFKKTLSGAVQEVKSVVRISEGKKAFRKPTSKLKDNIKLIFRKYCLRIWTGVHVRQFVNKLLRSRLINLQVLCDVLNYLIELLYVSD